MALGVGDAAIVLDFPPQCGPVRHARSTIILGSIAALRDAGHFDRYRAALPAEHRDELVQAVAGVWIPVDIAMSHYRSCEALGLSPEAEAALGRATFARSGGTIFGTITRLAKGVGVTPWTLLPQLQRFWDRGYDGGGIRVLKVGPKEARLDLVQCAMSEHRYYRNALRGLLQAVLQLFCTRSFVQEIANPRRPRHTVALRAQWA